MKKYQADVFMAIADPNRRYILSLLAAGSLTVSALAGHFDMTRPAVSKHIHILQEAGMLTMHTSGRERYCELNPDGFDELKDWMAFYDQFWNERMENLGALLKKQHKKKIS